MSLGYDEGVEYAKRIKMFVSFDPLADGILLIHESRRESDPKEALKDLNEALRLLSGVEDEIAKARIARAYLYKGIAYANLKKYEKALEELDKAIEIMEELGLEELGQAYLERGKILVEQKEYDEAIDSLHRAVLLLKDPLAKADARVHKTLAYFYLGNKLEALDELSKAIAELSREREGVKRDIFLAELYRLRAETYAYMGIPNNAEADAIKAIRLSKRYLGVDPRASSILSLSYKALSKAFLMNGKYKEAAKAIIKALRYMPNKQEVRNDVIETLLSYVAEKLSSRGLHKIAIKALNSALDIEGLTNNQLARIYVELAENYLELDLLDEAEISLLNALDMVEEKNDWLRGKIYITLSKLYRKRGEVEKAEKVLKKVDKIFKKSDRTGNIPCFLGTRENSVLSSR